MLSFPSLPQSCSVPVQASHALIEFSEWYMPVDWEPGSEDTLTPYQLHASNTGACEQTADQLLQELRRAQAIAAEQVLRSADLASVLCLKALSLAH